MKLSSQNIKSWFSGLPIRIKIARGGPYNVDIQTHEVETVEAPPESVEQTQLDFDAAPEEQATAEQAPEENIETSDDVANQNPDEAADTPEDAEATEAAETTEPAEAEIDTNTEAPAEEDTATESPELTEEAEATTEEETSEEADTTSDEPEAPETEEPQAEQTPEDEKTDTTPPAAENEKKPTTPKPTTVTKTIEIKITLPTLPKRLPTRQEIIKSFQTGPRRRLAMSVAILILVVAVLGTTHWFTSSNKATGAAATARPELERSNPSFRTVLPGGKTIAQLGGWARISPPDRDPVYAYIDKINTTQINVSEQPLPKGFKANLDQRVGEVAQNFGATQKVAAANTTIYIGTDEKGPQSVILSKNDLLILIKSADTLTPTDWVTYVNSLN